MAYPLLETYPLSLAVSRFFSDPRVEDRGQYLVELCGKILADPVLDRIVRNDKLLRRQFRLACFEAVRSSEKARNSQVLHRFFVELS